MASQTLGVAEVGGEAPGRVHGWVRFFAVREASMLVALVLIWLFFAIQSGGLFVSSLNLSNLAVELSITAILSLGMLLVMLPGHIDLSIGSGVGLFGGLAAVLVYEYLWPAPLALAVCAVAAIAVWVLMGGMIVGQRIPAFIITLAGLSIFRGLHWKVIHNATIPVTVGGRENLFSMLTTWYLPPWLGWALGALAVAGLGLGALSTRRRRRAFGFDIDSAEIAFAKWFVAGQLVLLFVLVCNQYRGIPLSAAILAATALAVWVLTRHTRFGRYLYAIGGNEEAAVISGIPVRRIVIAAFGIMGLVVALGGFLQTAYPGYSTTTVGQLLELDAIAACVIGGTSLRGGRGTVLGVLFGSLIMASLVNGMTLMAVSPEMKYIARGVVLALAVWMDVKLSAKG